MTSAFFGDSKLGYYVVVDLELYPGTSIPANKKLSIACDIQKEKIKESFAELRGTVYRPTPLNQLYSLSPEMSSFKPIEIKTDKDKDKDKDKEKDKRRGGTRKARKIRKTKKNKKSRKNQKSKKMKKTKNDKKQKTIKNKKR